MRLRAILVALALLAACGGKAPPDDPYLADLKQRVERLKPEVEREIGRKLGKIDLVVLPSRRIREDRIPWWRQCLARIENGPRGDELDAEVRAWVEDNVECVVATVDPAGRIVLPDSTEERAADVVAAWLPPSVFDRDLRARDLLLVHEMIHVHQIRHLWEAAFYGSIRSRADILARMAVGEGHAEYLTRKIASRIGLSDLYEDYHRDLEPTGRYVQGERFVAAVVGKLGYEEAIRRIFTDPPSLAAVSSPEEYFRKSEPSRWGPISEDLRRWLARECGEAYLQAVSPSMVREIAGDAAAGFREGVYLESELGRVKAMVLVAESDSAARDLHVGWTGALERSQERRVDAGVSDTIRLLRRPDDWTIHCVWFDANIRQHVIRDGALILDVQCADSEAEQGAERLARRALRFLTDASWREAWLKGDKDLLRNGDRDLRLAAVSRLKGFVPDEDWEVRWLGRFYEANDKRKGEPERTAALTAAIQDPHPAMVTRGLRMAQRMLLWNVPWPVLRERLGHDEVAVRRAAWDLMDTQISWDEDPKEWQAPRDEVLALIAKALDDEDVTVRAEAVECLHKLKGESGLEPVFRRALTDEYTRVRQRALITLSVYKFDFPQLLPEIVDLVDERPDVAAEALGNLGPAAEAALPWLTDLLDNPEACAEAAAAIWKIAGDPAPLFAVVADSVAAPRPKGIGELGEMGASARPMVPEVARALAHESRWVRIGAAEALEKIGGPEAKEALTRRLDVEKDPKVMEGIRKALGELQ